MTDTVHWRRPGRALLWLLPALALISGCAPRSALYQPADSLYMRGPSPDYGAYVAGAREHLAAHAVAVEGFPRERQIAWRMPFETEPGADCDRDDTAGLLLVHGLADTPTIFRGLAERLSARCVRVRALLLPGHGTRPGDLVAAESEQWLSHVREHAAALADRVDRLYLGGHSIGGALATQVALERGDVSGLVVFAPAWGLRGFGLAMWAATLAEPFIDFVELEPEHNPVKYETLATNVGDEVRETVARTRDALSAAGTIDLPTVVVATAADSVIDLDVLQRTFRQRLVSPRSRMILYRDARDPLPPWWQPERMSAFDAYLPDERILELSHQSLPVSPQHPLYGRAGPLRHCLEPNGLSREACLQRDPGTIWYGAYRGPDERDPARTTARLTWNPHFDALVGTVAPLMAGD